MTAFNLEIAVSARFKAHVSTVDLYPFKQSTMWIHIDFALLDMVVVMYKHI